MTVATDASYTTRWDSTSEAVRRIKVRPKFVTDYHWRRAWQVSVAGRVIVTEGSFAADTQ